MLVGGLTTTGPQLVRSAIAQLRVPSLSSRLGPLLVG